MVMTTEILRNIMYRTEEEAADESSTGRDSLSDVGLVVLDEVCTMCIDALLPCLPGQIDRFDSLCLLHYS